MQQLMPFHQYTITVGNQQTSAPPSSLSALSATSDTTWVASHPILTPYLIICILRIFRPPWVFQEVDSQLETNCKRFIRESFWY